MKNRRCFVISPIGGEQSEIREHADDVFDFIIKPAIEECDVDARRSDHLREPGRISDQMFSAILKEDFCIALLTGYNPNVFFELAVAQSAGKPVIILMEKGKDLPFDIKDLRCIYYDFKPRSVRDKIYKAELVDHIRGLEAQGWLTESLLTRYGWSPVSNIQPEGTFIPSASEYPKGGWSRLLEAATKGLDMMGITLEGWKKTPQFAQKLKQLAEKDCRVRILLMHPSDPHLPDRFTEDLSPAQLTSAIKSMVAYYSRIAANVKNIEVRTIRKGTLSLYLARNDAEAIGIPYLFSERSGDCPLWSCQAGTQLYETFEREFEALWEINQSVENQSK